MKRKLTIALCSALVVATALPALAITNEINGWFWVRGIYGDLSFGKYYEDIKSTSALSGSPAAPHSGVWKEFKPDALVDQRFRPKWTMGINDYLKLVYFAEIDLQWGDNSYMTGRNEGGALGADTVNIETKNIFMELKVPNTPVTATIGMQGFADTIDFALFNADMAGVKLAAKEVAPGIDVTAGWFKLFENNSPFYKNGLANGNDAATQSQQDRGSDDTDLYAVQFAMKANDALKVGADLYYLLNSRGNVAKTPLTVAPNANPQDSNTNGDLSIISGGANFGAEGTKQSLWYLDGNASYKLAPVTISGWLLYNWGEAKDAKKKTNGTVDGTKTYGALAGSVKAEAALPDVGATCGLRAMYFPGDKKAYDGSAEYVVNPFATGASNVEMAPFAKDGLMIFLFDPEQNSYPSGKNAGGKAMVDAAYGGYGLTGFVLSGSFVPPANKNLYVKAAVGYFMANEKTIDDGTAVQANGMTKLEKKGKTLGTEFAARVGYIIAEKFDLSLNGSFVSLGDFYDKTAKSSTGATTEDPNNPYEVYLMAKTSF